MKSALPCASTLPEAAEEGYVDRWLPNCWQHPVRCVNLRATDWEEKEMMNAK
jgi:hypothetical protein